MLFFCAGLALLAAMTAHADEVPCESFSYQVETLRADIEATHCIAENDLFYVCDTFAKHAIVTCMEEDSVAARDDCMEDYFAAENIVDDEGYVMSGQEVLDCCKSRKYTKFYELFEEIHSTVCPPENSAGARRKRSTYYPQHYEQHLGLNTIWFQYHLCKDQGINCWFFTQGWNQGEFGSYYLYDELLGEENDAFADLDFATLLLLGSLGGGHGGHDGYGGYGGGIRYRRETDDAADSGCDNDCKVCIDGIKCLDGSIDREPRFFFGAIISWFQSLMDQTTSTTTAAPVTAAPRATFPPTTPAPATKAPSATVLLLEQLERRRDDVLDLSDQSKIKELEKTLVDDRKADLDAKVVKDAAAVPLLVA